MVSLLKNFCNCFLACLQQYILLIAAMVAKFSSFSAFQAEKIFLGKAEKHESRWYGMTSAKMAE